jgi:hypothetical protein
MHKDDAAVMWVRRPHSVDTSVVVGRGEAKADVVARSVPRLGKHKHVESSVIN